MAMQFCASRATSNLPAFSTLLAGTPQLPPKTAIASPSARTFHIRYPRFSTLLLRAAASDDPNGFSPLFTEKRDGVIVLEDSPSDSSIAVEDSSLEPVEEEPKEEPVEVAEEQPSELLKDFSLESIDAYSVALYGSGAFFGLWLVSAIVGAVDSIPVVPKLLEVVGLGYTVWFTARFLLFKKSRQELAAKIDEVKEQVIGSG